LIYELIQVQSGKETGSVHNSDAQAARTVLGLTDR